MKQTAEEAKIAIDERNVDEKGVPQITEITYGAWSERSYRTITRRHQDSYVNINCFRKFIFFIVFKHLGVHNMQISKIYNLLVYRLPKLVLV